MSKTTHKKSFQKNRTGKNATTVTDIISGKGIAFTSIFIISIIVFSNSITEIFIALDDQVYINDNPFIKLISWQNIKSIFSTFYNANYHPFTTLLYAVEYKLFGLDASSYHITSLIIHCVNSCLIYILIEKIFQQKGFALFGSLIFAIHPMHVESVVWISEQKDVLYSLFYFAGLISYVNYIKDKKRGDLYLTFFFFLFSLLSKSAAVTFPLILVLCDFYFKRVWNWKIILEKVPFFILSIIFGIVAILSQNDAGAISDVTMVPYTYLQRIFIVSFAMVYYIFKFIFPVDLCVLHYAPKIIPFYYYLCPLLIVLIGWITWRSKPLKSSLIFGLLFYLFSIILVIQIVPLGFVIVSERYSYIPYFGLIFILGSLYNSIRDGKIPISSRIRKYQDYFIAITILIFSFLSFQYIKKWKSSVSLFTDIAVKNSFSAYAYNSLGKVQNANGDLVSALKSFEYSIQLDSTISEAYFVSANIYFSEKRYDLATRAYLKVEKLKPAYVENLNNIAFLYSETGRLDDALLYYSKAISVKPSEYLYQRRATCNTYKKNYAEALNDYNNAIKINPFNADSYSNRGVCFYYLQQLSEACDDWEKASSMGYKNAEDLISKFCK